MAFNKFKGPFRNIFTRLISNLDDFIEDVRTR